MISKISAVSIVTLLAVAWMLSDDSAVGSDPWPEIAKLIGSPGAGAEVAGESVAIDGTTIAVGAPGSDAEAGAVYVFVNEGSGWSQQARLVASDPASGDEFGSAVAVTGDTILVGAHGNDDGGADSGSVYVFERVGSSWTESDKLTASDAAAGDNFGRRISVDSGSAAVSAFLDDDDGADSGSVYVFVRSGPTWSEQAKLTPSDGAAGDQFGRSVSISRDSAIVGAPFDDDSGTDSGSAYMFIRMGTSWSEQAKMVPTEVSAGDLFGLASAIDGDRAVVGAPLDDSLEPDAGAIYVFEKSGTAWFQRTILTRSGNDFGEAVDIAGTRILIGADGTGTSGAAYVYSGSGSNWSPEAELLPSDGGTNDLFGDFVALDGVSVVGAPLTDDLGVSSGSAYVFGNILFVDTLVDELDGSCSDGDCSLRDAVALSGVGSVVMFASSIHGGTIGLTLGTLPIGGPGLLLDVGNTVIDGVGADMTLDGDVWINSDGNAIKGVTITGFLEVESSNNMIGGTAPADGNRLGSVSIDSFGVSPSGNVFENNVITVVSVFGVAPATSLPAPNVFRSNFIGVDSDGVTELGNAGHGVEITESSDTHLVENLISGNGGDGIRITSNASLGTLIHGNKIGTNIAGTDTVPNDGNGIATEGWFTQIGGSGPGQGNLVSGNGGNGIRLANDGPQNVTGNLVGTNTMGTAPLPNTGFGIFDSTVLAAAALPYSISENVISGNLAGGIMSVTFAGTISENKVGTDPTGSTDVRNMGPGISVDELAEVTGNTVGFNTGTGISGSFSNTISGNSVFSNAEGIVLTGVGNAVSNNQVHDNAGDGVRLGSGTLGLINLVSSNDIHNNTGNGATIVGDGQDNELRENLIYSNSGLGIDIGNNGVTLNDPNDADIGFQNFPVLTSATPGSLRVKGSLNSTPNQDFIVEFFESPTCDDSGPGGGMTFVGQIPVSTNQSNDVPIDHTFDSYPATVGHYITSTVTGLNPVTSEASEFSVCREVAPDSPAVTLAFEMDEISIPTGRTHTVTLEAADLPPGTDTAQVLLRYSRAVFQVSNLNCVGLLEGGLKLEPSDVGDDTALECSLVGGSAGGDGPVLSFDLSRIGPNATELEMIHLIDEGGPFATSYFQGGTQFSFSPQPGLPTGVVDTLNVTSGVTVSGRVSLQGVTLPNSICVGVEVYLVDPLETDPSLDNALAIATVAPNGTFEFTGVGPGTYDVIADASKHVIARLVELVVTDSDIVLPDVELRGGDVSGDEAVAGGDVSVIVTEFGSSGPALQGDANCDGFVTGGDISLVVSNFGLMGPTQWR